jgi:hypothetical protein
MRTDARYLPHCCHPNLMLIWSILYPNVAFPTKPPCHRHLSPPSRHICMCLLTAKESTRSPLRRVGENAEAMPPVAGNCKEGIAEPLCRYILKVEQKVVCLGLVQGKSLAKYMRRLIITRRRRMHQGRSGLQRVLRLGIGRRRSEDLDRRHRLWSLLQLLQLQSRLLVR